MSLISFQLSWSFAFELDPMNANTSHKTIGRSTQEMIGTFYSMVRAKKELLFEITDRRINHVSIEMQFFTIDSPFDVYEIGV